MNHKLASWINEQKKKGFKRKQIIEHLKKHGYKEKDIYDAFPNYLPLIVVVLIAASIIAGVCIYLTMNNKNVVIIDDDPINLAEIFKNSSLYNLTFEKKIGPCTKLVEMLSECQPYSCESGETKIEIQGIYSGKCFYKETLNTTIDCALKKETVESLVKYYSLDEEQRINSPLGIAIARQECKVK